MLYITNDGGQHWDTIQNFPTNNLGPVQFVNDSIGWVSIPSTANSGMLYSTDGGLSWRRQEVPDVPLDAPLWLAMPNDTVGFALSYNTAKAYRYRARPPACGPALLLPADSSLGRLPELR